MNPSRMNAIAIIAVILSIDPANPNASPQTATGWAMDLYEEVEARLAAQERRREANGGPL